MWPKSEAYLFVLIMIDNPTAFIFIFSKVLRIAHADFLTNRAEKPSPINFIVSSASPFPEFLNIMFSFLWHQWSRESHLIVCLHSSVSFNPFSVFYFWLLGYFEKSYFDVLLIYHAYLFNRSNHSLKYRYYYGPSFPSPSRPRIL